MFSRGSSYENPILILNGWEATGKTGLGNILRHLKDVPPFRYSYQLEWMLYFGVSSQIDKIALTALVNSELDLASYNLCYGREINFRMPDQSSVFNHPNPIKYIKRSLSREIDESSINHSMLYLMTHNLYPCYGMLRDILGSRLSFIEIMRDPLCMIDQILYNYHSLYSRPVPRNFTLSNKRTRLPCFSFDSDILLSSQSPWDFAVKQIELCYSYSYDALSSKSSTMPLVLFFEDLTEDPYPSLSSIESYTGRVFMPSVSRALKSERMPRTKAWAGRKLPIYKKIGMRNLSSYETSYTLHGLSPDHSAYINKYLSDGMTKSEIDRLLECRDRYFAFKASVRSHESDSVSTIKS